MSTRIRRLYAVAGLAAAALAGVAPAQTTPGTELRYEVRVYDAANDDGWATSVNARPGDRIEVRARAVWVGTAPAWALQTIKFQPVVSGWTTTDTLATNAVLGRTGTEYQPDAIGPTGGDFSTPIGSVLDAPGQYGRLRGWAFTALPATAFLRGHLGTGTASGLLRIAQANITNWIGVGPTSGTSAINNVNGSGGVNSESGVVVPTTSNTSPLLFKFAFFVGDAGFDRSLSISTPENGFGRVLSSGAYVGNVRWWASASEGTPSIQTDAFSNEAVVNVVPSPSAAAAGLVWLAAGRRRRRGCAH